MTEKVETRRVTFNEFELRAGPSGDGMSFAGYASVFNSPSEPLPFIETIAPGAFSRSLRSHNNTRMYINHDSNLLLATTRAKTLRLKEDEKGLHVDADLPDTQAARDLSTLMRRGDVDSMSFGFNVPDGGDTWSGRGERGSAQSKRVVNEVRLFEVSVITGFPAYTATEATVRSFDVLATRAGVDPEQLTAALTGLESGATLTADQAALLRETVAKLEPAPVVPEFSQVDILSKHLDLLKTVV